MHTKNKIQDFLLITAGTGIIAVAVYFFMLPSNLTIGSASALALVLSNFIPLPVSVITFALNALLLIIGFLLIGPEFGAKTIYTSLLLPAYIYIFELVFPGQASLTQDPALDVVGYILVVSMGQAILFSCNASSSGLDIVGKLMNKYLHMELGKALALSGFLVAASSAVCYDSKTVILSLMGTYFGGMVLDQFIFGLHLKRKVCIISAKADEIVQFILHDLHSGASLYEVTGAYDGTVRKEINVIVDKQEFKQLKTYIQKTDPGAFVTVYSVSEMRYIPKK